MSISSKFKEAVRERQIEKVRIMLKDKLIFIAIPTGSFLDIPKNIVVNVPDYNEQFIEYRREAEIKLRDDLYDDHDDKEETKSEDLKKLSKDDLLKCFYKNLATVIKNFSRKRVNKLQEIASLVAKAK